MKNNLKFDNMSRDELAHYIVDHRNTPEGMEARRVLIQRIAEKAKNHGIELNRPKIQAKSFNN